MKTTLLQTCLLSALLALPAAVQAQFNYTTNNGAITITGYTGPGGAVTIPATVNGLPVTSIGDYAFSDSAVTSVAISSNVAIIGNKTFQWCHAMTVINVDAANSSYSSLNGVLFDKEQTTLIKYPEGLVGSYTMPDGVTNIGDDAFYSCKNLTAVTMSASLYSIGGQAFLQCFGLRNVTIPNNVTNIGDYAFFQTGLTNITIGSGVTSIGDYALVQSGLTSVTIPDSVVSIGDWAFEDCESMTNVIIGSGVTNIGEDAFNSCIELSSVTIPPNVSAIGDEAFAYCRSLTAINVDAANLFLSSVAGVLFDKSQTTLIQYPNGKASTGNYIIPNSVINIGAGAFNSCYSLTNITIGSSVTGIGDYAFFQCGLTNVRLPDSVESIGNWAFGACDSLANVAIGHGVTSIGDYAFDDCGLNNVMIPDSVINIGDWAFASCYSLTNVTISSGVTNITDHSFAQCANLTSVFFMGNAPSADLTAFFIYGPGYSVLEAVTVYYLPGTTGWDDFSANTGLPTAPWLPQVQTGDGSFGTRTNQFGFNINWASGQTVVVEASASLVNPVWQRVQTNTLASDSIYFSDSQSSNYPARFYRLRSQ